MEQYFVRQSANCCQLNFSNTLAPTPRHIISPKKNYQKPIFITNKSAKKSLKAIHSHHTSKDNKKQTRFQQDKAQNKQLSPQLNDYGQVIEKKNRTENGRFQHRKQLKFSALDSNIKKFKSQEKKEVIHSPNKAFKEQELRNFRFSQKPSNFTKVQRQQQPRGSVLAKALITLPYFRQQPKSPEAIQYYRQVPSHYIQSTPIHSSNQPNFHQIPQYTRSPIKNHLTSKQYNSNPYMDQARNTLSTSSLLNKKPSANYSQNFKKIYGEVEIEDEIKHDLMMSMEFNKNDYQLDNGVSMLTKCPPSEESTILPPESKLKPKYQYQIDSFATNNPSRRSFTQKNLKAESFMGSKQQSFNLNGRQKFKSIVSVESQHSSTQSQGAQSVIIDHHPQSMISGNPIKSLL